MLPNEAYKPTAKANPLIIPTCKREKYTRNGKNMHPYA
jgi:hypothetical protein